MRIKILLYLFVFGLISAQSVTLRLNLFEPFTASEFAALGMSRELGVSPRVFSVDIIPEGILVWAEVKVDWQAPGGNGFGELYSFSTEKFLSRTVYNDELGYAIDIDDYKTDEDLIEKNLLKGKPTGNYIIAINLYNDKNKLLASVVKDVEFRNPAQTLSLQLPLPESIQDPGNVTAAWDILTGVDNYVIKANVRENSDQSLEDALNSGTPLIDNKALGDVTSINIRDYLEREWLPGEEIVFQVYAEIDGPGSGTQLYSEIVNFYLEGENTGGIEQFGDDFNKIETTLPTNIEKDILNSFLNGELGKIVNVTIDGKFLSRAELQKLLDSLKLNPDKVVKISFIED